MFSPVMVHQPRGMAVLLLVLVNPVLPRLAGISGYVGHIGRVGEVGSVEKVEHLHSELHSQISFNGNSYEQ